MEFSLQTVIIRVILTYLCSRTLSTFLIASAYSRYRKDISIDHPN